MFAPFKGVLKGITTSPRSSRQIRGAAQPLLSAVALTITFLIASLSPVKAATLPVGFAETEIAVGLLDPTSMEFAPDGRLFVLLQGGTIRLIKNDSLLPTPVLNLTVDTYNERGLEGITFDPNFPTAPYIYVYYTAVTPTIHNRVSRFTMNGDVADPNSETIILDLDTLDEAGMHNAGAMRFGQDGKLYVAVGDNGRGANAQSLSNLFGKILRIDKDGSIPTDNPFYTTATGVNRAIWARGLRNPFSFQFQPGTWRMFINDVGGNVNEEINEGFRGGNYGWPTTEGPIGAHTEFIAPLYYYGHVGNDCAITGGTFYNPPITQFPAEYVGTYFFMDFCGRYIKVFDPETSQVSNFSTEIYAPVDLDVARDGSLYYLERGEGGIVRKVQYSGSQTPTISHQPVSLTISAGHPAAFSVDASGTAPLRFQWQRNGANISGATGRTYTLASPQLSDSGAAFRVVVSNAFGSVTSNAATLTVSPNQPPSATITTPVTGATYRAGDTISFAGTGTDAEDGTLPASAFTWQVDFHHNDHFHPFMPPTTGVQNGTFTIPRVGETSPNVWYRIHLTVTDSGGFTHHVYRDVQPQKVRITVASNVSGLQVDLDGQPQSAPFSFTSVVGMTRAIGVISPQALNGKNWAFGSWSDGGAITHNITVPTANRTYTVTWIDTTPPSAPSLSSPGSNATLDNVLPTFSWSAPARAVQYRLQVDNNADFSSPEINVTTASPRYTSQRVLGFGSYSWRVMAFNGVAAGSAWSQPRSFTLASRSDAVPVRNRFITATPRLTWYGVDWAIGYEIQVDNNGDFSSPEFKDDQLGSDALAVVTRPLANGSYYWRVRAKHPDGRWGAWSAVDRFTVAAPTGS
jgi:glucose/arabinose dehydrogenase